jgi:hypothetical protein
MEALKLYTKIVFKKIRVKNYRANMTIRCCGLVVTKHITIYYKGSHKMLLCIQSTIEISIFSISLSLLFFHLKNET